MNLEIVTPNGSKLTEKVSEITVCSVLGEMGVMPGHVPVITVLDIGRFQYIPEGGGDPKTLAVAGGFFEVADDNLIVITESAEFSDEIDVDRATEARDRAIKALPELLESNPEGYERKKRSLKRAEVRLAVAEGVTH